MFRSNDLTVSVFVVKAVLVTDEVLNRHFQLIEFLPKTVVRVSHLCLVNQALLTNLELIVSVKVLGQLLLTL